MVSESGLGKGKGAKEGCQSHRDWGTRLKDGPPHTTEDIPIHYTPTELEQLRESRQATFSSFSFLNEPELPNAVWFI